MEGLAIEHFMNVSEYKLTDLLSAAGATIGIIISGAIFLQFMSTKSIELGSRYRQLTSEYRQGTGEARHARLQAQIHIYRRRLRLMNYAARLASVALMSLLATMLAGGLSVMFPPVRAMKYFGTGGLFFGLMLIGCAVALELAENIMSRNELGEEIGDLEDVVNSTSC